MFKREISASETALVVYATAYKVACEMGKEPIKVARISGCEGDSEFSLLRNRVILQLPEGKMEMWVTIERNMVGVWKPTFVFWSIFIQKIGWRTGRWFSKTTKLRCSNCHKYAITSQHTPYVCPQCNGDLIISGD